MVLADITYEQRWIGEDTAMHKFGDSLTITIEDGEFPDDWDISKITDYYRNANLGTNWEIQPNTVLVDNIRTNYEPFQNEDGTNINEQPQNSSTSIVDVSTTNTPTVDNIPPVNEQAITLVDEVIDSIQSYKAWDPRIYRFDEYFVVDGLDASIGGDTKLMPIRIPFASNTIGTAFGDLTNLMDKQLIAALIKSGDIKPDSYVAENLFSISSKKDPSSGSSDPGDGEAEKYINNTVHNAYSSAKFITHDTKQLENNSLHWGVQSIMNPYSLTKLVGGLSVEKDNKFINYMYDIRDQRRFYQWSDNNVNDVLSISNPTVTQLINWSNSDQWGRTPYSFQDFVYCKYFGLIPNNRLITLRRYTVPTYDNLQFENMFGAQETTTTDANGNTITVQETSLTSDNKTGAAHKTFSPVAYVVTWFGGDTGNSLNSLMSFTTGIKWENLEAKVWDISGDTGESKQAVIDKLLGDGAHTGLFRDAELTSLNPIFHSASIVSAKVASYGKFALNFSRPQTDESQDAYEKRMGANVDPYTSTYINRIKGPVNRIDSVKKRKEGIEFNQSLSIKCEYRAKAIGGINPKAALLDCLGNCLEMVSPHAIFWGGGHRFEIHPQIYPFHDGGWRDSFMARIYDGKFLGDDGAIAAVLGGFKKVGENEAGGGFSFDTAKKYLGQLGGGALGMLGAAVSSLSSLFGNSNFLNGISDKLFNAGASASGENVQDVKKAGGMKVDNLFKSLKKMWNNRMVAATMMPSIQGNGNLLVGEPTGEWHLTVGNPLNPIMVIGNLVCNNMKVEWDEELGPDDFPIGFSVTYSLDHAMPRDSDAIQSMFNRGMGKYYTLPDYISTSSDRITYVDKFTKDAGSGDTGNIKYKFAGDIMKETGWAGNKVYKISEGFPAPNSGNYNTAMITKFNPINTEAQRTVLARRNTPTAGFMSRIKSLAATRKQINN